MNGLVVSDASPLHYLVLIEAVDILPRLFTTVIVPPAVAAELTSTGTPAKVAHFIHLLPEWIEIKKPSIILSFGLDAGETEAIALAGELGIQTVLMDERRGRRAALQQGLVPVGTLALLEEAARMDWLCFEDSVERLRNLNFRIAENLIERARQRLRQGT